MAATELPTGFLANWALGGALASPEQLALAPAEAPVPGADEGLLGDEGARAALAAQALTAERAASLTPLLNEFYESCVAPVERVAACAVSLAS
jgi:hypothetical protein